MNNQEKDLINNFTEGTLINWNSETDGNPILYDLPSNKIVPPFTIEPITNYKKLEQDFQRTNYTKTFDLMFDVFTVGLLTNPATFELIVATEDSEDDESESFPHNGLDVLPQIDSFRVIIDYPIEHPVLVKFDALKGVHNEKEFNCSNLGYVLWQISKAYIKIYEDYKTWGVWGHSLHDLCYERITITKNGDIFLFIGS